MQRSYLTGSEHGDCGANSMVAPEPGSGVKSLEIKVETVDGFCQAESISMVDLLKMDVEGFEPQVLKGAAGMLREKKIRFVYAECDFAPNPDTPHANFFELHEIMSAADFCLVSFYCESFSLKHGSCHGNALFALKSLLPTTVPGAMKNII